MTNQNVTQTKKYLLLILIILTISLIYFFSKRLIFRQKCLDIGGQYSFSKNECFSINISLKKDLIKLCSSFRAKYSPCVGRCPKKSKICPTICTQVCEL